MNNDAAAATSSRYKVSFIWKKNLCQLGGCGRALSLVEPQMIDNTSYLHQLLNKITKGHWQNLHWYLKAFPTVTLLVYS